MEKHASVCLCASLNLEKFMKCTRNLWVEAMLKIASPVLEALSKEKLHILLPSDFHAEMKSFRCLEAFGRTICGIAPWLELEGLKGEEAQLQRYYRNLVRICIDKATDPSSDDFMNFNNGKQPLVDAAFLSHGIMRAPRQLFELLDDRVKVNLISALKSTRKIEPNESNWLLFSSMVEAALWMFGEETEDVRLYRGIKCFVNEWYCGDGVYGDGKCFHFDYYNSFVIQPQLLDIVQSCVSKDKWLKEIYPIVEKRASRYAELLERLIAPDGSYPILGRSVCYRFGAFQLLSQAVLQGFLPKTLLPEQVRTALTAVIKKCMDNPDIFDREGWLTPGVYGCQPQLAEEYINIGSLYLCCAVFLPLGLHPETRFWSAPDADWTQKKIWLGEYAEIDHAVD